MVHLANYMAANNLDDDAVAAGIERSRVTVSRIRRRKVRPDWQTIERIKEFTSGAVTADDFQHLDQPEDQPSSPSPSPDLKPEVAA